MCGLLSSHRIFPFLLFPLNPLHTPLQYDGLRSVKKQGCGMFLATNRRPNRPCENCPPMKIRRDGSMVAASKSNAEPTDERLPNGGANVLIGVLRHAKSGSEHVRTRCVKSKKRCCHRAFSGTDRATNRPEECGMDVKRASNEGAVPCMRSVDERPTNSGEEIQASVSSEATTTGAASSLRTSGASAAT